MIIVLIFALMTYACHAANWWDFFGTGDFFTKYREITQRPPPPVRPSILWQGIINYTIFHIFTKFYTQVLYTTRDRARLDFVVHWIIEGRNLIGDINEFLPVLSMFLDRFVWNLVQQVCTKYHWENQGSVKVVGAKGMSHLRAWTNCCCPHMLTILPI